MNQKYQEIENARAFWKDAVRQYWEALQNPKTSKESLEGYRAYYLRARGNLKTAFEGLGVR